MSIVVQKFGGSSVADLERLGQVADSVVATRRTGRSVVVVVSAMGKTTEGLLALARSAASGGATATGPPYEPPRRELDMLVSTGERVSMALLSIAVQARGFPAVSFTGSQSGIITDDRHFDARIVEVRPERIETELERGNVVIVAGYQGMSRGREITTLGRGGSDTTAVALAAALAAEHCEIYSDVDGVYSADPGRVPDTRHLPELDYETMQQAAESGAKVLNARAVEWARTHGVIIHARRTADFQRGGAGRQTSVAGGCRHSPAVLVAVDPRVLLLEAEAQDWQSLLDGAGGAALPIGDLTLDGERASAVVSLASVPDPARALGVLAARVPGRVRVTQGVSQVSVIGAGVTALPERVAQALAALPSVPLLARSSPLRLSVVLPEAERDSAEATWHRLFVG